MNGEHKIGGGIAPAFVGVGGVAALLGVSERTVHALRSRGLIPEPVVLGPRALRWPTDELIAHLKASAPRGGFAEPAHLKAGKAAKGSA